MSQLRCPECDRLWSANCAAPGERCGVRIDSKRWCDGKLVEHECGGPGEACGLRGCDECGLLRSKRASAGRTEP